MWCYYPIFPSVFLHWITSFADVYLTREEKKLFTCYISNHVFCLAVFYDWHQIHCRYSMILSAFFASGFCTKEYILKRSAGKTWITASAIQRLHLTFTKETNIQDIQRWYTSEYQNMTNLLVCIKVHTEL